MGAASLSAALAFGLAGGAPPATGAGRALSDAPAGSGIASPEAGGQASGGEDAARRGPGAGGLAGLVRSEAPANAYITRDGLDWAWAAPVPAALADLDLQAAGGWRLPTAAELAAAPTASDFVFPGANVPLGGADPASGAAFLMPGPGLDAAAACAAPWFGAEHRHCDWVDGEGVFALPWAGKAGETQFSEQLLVRDARPRNLAVAGREGERAPAPVSDPRG